MNHKSTFALWTATLTLGLGLTASCGGGDDADSDGTGASKGNGGIGGETTGGTNSGKSTGGKSNTGGETSPGGTYGDGDTGGSDVGGQGGEAPNSACAEACLDDGNPCTEDVCDETTGKCGIPRTGNVCDDGVFCNGGDTCDAGKCTAHEGNPCGSADQCDEGANSCICTVDADCLGGTVTELSNGVWGVQEDWSECEYANICMNEGVQRANRTQYTCVSGLCETTSLDDATRACGKRNQNGVSCSDGTYCNGEETCKNQICSSGDAVECNLIKATPYCNNKLESCVECNNNSQCVGAEVCQSNACDSSCIRAKNGSHVCRSGYTCGTTKTGVKGTCVKGCFSDIECGKRGTCSGATKTSPGVCKLL